jgi:hypothetical protein
MRSMIAIGILRENASRAHACARGRERLITSAPPIYLEGNMYMILPSYLLAGARNAGHAGCMSHCRRQLDRSLNYFPRPRALLMAAKRLYLSPPPTPRVILEGRGRNPRIRLTRSMFTASWDRILPYNGVSRRMLNGPAHNGMNVHVPMRLTYDLVLCERDFLSEETFLPSSSSPSLLPVLQYHILPRVAFARAANSLLLHACSRVRASILDTLVSYCEMSSWGESSQSP